MLNNKFKQGKLPTEGTPKNIMPPPVINNINSNLNNTSKNVGKNMFDNKQAIDEKTITKNNIIPPYNLPKNKNNNFINDNNNLNKTDMHKPPPQNKPFQNNISA